jgi:hypothetical protein
LDVHQKFKTFINFKGKKKNSPSPKDRKHYASEFYDRQEMARNKLMMRI